MAKSLVIVESPSKVKSIQKYLGKDYAVASSKGHIADLPKSDLGVDTEKNFEPSYVVTKKKAVSDLKKKFKDADTLILAVDPDREGEAIGWHVAQRLGVITKKGNIKKGMKLKRIVFTSITEDAVKDAIKKPRDIDMNLVNAQQARRVLDRLVGYKLSPLLWKKIRFGLSAGRVQSVAVRLIVEKEEERDAFNPEEYWKIKSALTDSGNGNAKVVILEKSEDDENSLKEATESMDGIMFELSKIDGKKAGVKNKKEAEKVIDDVKDEKWVISDISAKKSKRNPKPPFTTSTMQQTASGMLGFSAKKTMMVAQKLYEAGKITYMRTDSTNLAPEAVNAARKLIEKKFGKKHLPDKPRFYKTKAKVAQEAHEAIRPADFKLEPGKSGLTDDQFKLYALIWQRAVASQMVPAELENGKIEIKVGKYIFSATGQRILFKGYLAVYPEKVSENELPKLKVGQELNLNDLLASQHFTRPPARYSEASLIKALESYGIGRPSTYVPIIQTIQTRKYVEKEGKYFKPTDTGIVVTRLLKDNFENVVDYEFTANMENSLDNVANGEEDWVKMMGDFYNPFEKRIADKDKEIERSTYTVLDEAPEGIVCPDCGGKMDIKLGRYGKFYSCQKWPDCKGILNLDGKTQEEMEAEAYSKDFLAIYKSAPRTDNGDDYKLKEGRYGKFWAHPGYPKVKDAKPLEYTTKIFKEIYGDAPKAEDGSKMELRKGRFGEFWAHKKYPDVKEVIRLNKKEVAERKREVLGE